MSSKLLSRFLIWCLAIILFGCQDSRIVQIRELQQASTEAKRAGNLNEAIALTRKIQALDPNEVDHLDSLAKLYFQAGKFDAAKMVSDSAIDIIPSKETVRIALACAKQLNHYSKGEGLVLLLLRLGEPESAGLIFDQAWFQYHAWHYAESIVSLERIVNNLNYRYLTRLEQVTINGQTQLVRMPLLAVCYNMMGASYYNLGEVDLARAKFEKALEVYPEYGAAKDNLAELSVD